MALTFSLVDTWDDGKRIHVSGTIAASGSYSTGGDTLDLSQTPIVASSQPPINGTAWMDGLAGYDYVFIPGAAMNSNKVKIFQQGASAGAFPELAAGAYPRRHNRRFHHVLPVTSWTAAGSKQVSVTNIPTGPANVVQRLLAFTAEAAQVFITCPIRWCSTTTPPLRSPSISLTRFCSPA
jgi:hypothetical protein